MTDLKSFIPSDTHTFEIKNPVDGTVLTKDDGKPMTITIYSPYSDTFRKVAHEQAKKRLSKAKGSENKELTIEDYQEFSLDTVVATTSAWSITFDKEDLPFSEAKVKEVYKSLPWLVEQVKEAQDRIQED